MPPHLTLCSYQAFSIPTMWNMVQPEGHPSPSREYDITKTVYNALTNLRIPILEEYKKVLLNEPTTVTSNVNLYDKMFSTVNQIDRSGSKTMLFTMLRNTPNTTFEKVIDKLAENLENVISYCTNGKAKCTNFTHLSVGPFPRCFRYDTSPDMGNEGFNDGITSGIQLVLLSAGQLMSLEYDKVSAITGKDHVPNGHLFSNTFSPLSSNGIQLSISRPGVNPNIEEVGISISPGYYTLISVTGKEIIRKPWPYSDCTTVDYEIQRYNNYVESCSIHIQEWWLSIT